MQNCWSKRIVNIAVFHEILHCRRRCGVLQSAAGDLNQVQTDDHKMAINIKFITLWILGLMLAATAGQVEAGIVYSQSILSTADRGGYQDSGQEFADDFSLAAAAVINVVNWQGSYYATDVVGMESFTIHFYTDTSGLPSSSPFASQVVSVKLIDSGIDLIGKNLYNYSANISNVALAAGVTYWVSTYSNDSPTNYAWADSLVGSIEGVLRFPGLGVDWIEYDNDDRSNHIFSLEGSTAQVPEPSSFALLDIGALGMMFAHRIRRRTKSWHRALKVDCPMRNPKAVVVPLRLRGFA